MQQTGADACEALLSIIDAEVTGDTGACLCCRTGEATEPEMALLDPIHPASENQEYLAGFTNLIECRINRYQSYLAVLSKSLENDHQ